MTRVLAVLCLVAAAARPAAAQDPIPRPAQILTELRLEGATVYKKDDVLWLLRLREGAPLPQDAAEVARALQERYDRDGYTEARATATFDAGRLTLTVDEGRIDDIEILGVADPDAARFRQQLGIVPGDIYNKRIVGRAAARLIAESGGALSIGRSRRQQPGGDRAESTQDEIVLERRGTRHVLVIPLRWNDARTSVSFGGTGREDVFSPADGLAPAVTVSSTIFDPRFFNHTVIDGYVSYKFGRSDPGYSVGIERPLFRGPARLFIGGELHDITTSDDLWRLSSAEQSVVSLFFKNSFRDYYRRQGGQVFGVLRAGDHNELSVMARWDRHRPLPNSTTYSFFRDDATFPPALPVADQQVNAWVFGYTFDTRPLTAAGNRTTYARHLKDSLYGYRARQSPGLRIDWTSEIAGRGLGGDARFDRHIVNARGHLPLSRRAQLSMRGLFGFSNGQLPVERVFALGGIGSVHGYGFKEAVGTGMVLVNTELRFDLGRRRDDERDPFNVFTFYDAGRVTGPTAPRNWLNGVGAGFGMFGVRVEFGFRATDVPESRQILVRWSPTF